MHKHTQKTAGPVKNGADADDVSSHSSLSALTFLSSQGGDYRAPPPKNLHLLWVAAGWELLTFLHLRQPGVSSLAQQTGLRSFYTMQES